MATITAYSPVVQPLTFKAVWTNENKHLDEGALEKITRYAFFILNYLSTALILPSTRKSMEEIESINQEFEAQWTNPITSVDKLLKNNFRPIPIEVTAPDGAILHGTFFRNAAATDASPTVIFFQPNAMLSKQGAFDWVLTQAALQEIPYNFVYFDYRGCDGKSDRPRFAKDLYLDGESIYQFVKDKLHVPPNDIHFYGWSLGGGISANVKELHKECTGNYVNERSFTSINDTIKNIICQIITFINERSFIAISDTINNLFNRFLASSAGSFTSLLSWNITAVKAIENLKGKTLIVHHPDDELMKEEASLYRHIFERGTASSFPEISHLDLSKSRREPPFIHGAPLSCYNNQVFNPEAEIAKFLFSSSLSMNQRMVQIFRNSSTAFREKVYRIVARDYQNGGHYWGSGADACYNRNGQSLSESQLADAVIAARLES